MRITYHASGSEAGVTPDRASHGVEKSTAENRPAGSTRQDVSSRAFESGPPGSSASPSKPEAQSTIQPELFGDHLGKEQVLGQTNRLRLR